MDKTSKLNIKRDAVNYEDPPNVSEFLQEKSPLKHSYDSVIMLDANTSKNDTVSSTKKSKMTHLEME